MRINHNIAALNSYRQLSFNNVSQAKSLEKLSSGMRINKAADDAAGLAISEKMRGQIRGLQQATRNAQDGISLIQTAEGALNEVHSIVQRMRELVVQANNDSNTPDDRAEIQKEIEQLYTEVTEIGNRTEFNTKKLIDGTLGIKAAGTGTAEAALATAGVTIDVSGAVSGATYTFAVVDAANTIALSYGGVTQTLTVTDNNAIAAGTVLNFDKLGVKLTFGGPTDFSTATYDAKTIVTTGNSATFQIGANNNQVLSVQISDMRASELGDGATAADKLNAVNVTNTSQTFTKRLSIIDESMKKVSQERAKLGAYQNRLEHTINNLGTAAENLTAAESRVRDVDMAEEMMTFTKNNILMQAATAMLERPAA